MPARAVSTDSKGLFPGAQRCDDANGGKIGGAQRTITVFHALSGECQPRNEALATLRGTPRSRTIKGKCSPCGPGSGVNCLRRSENLAVDYAALALRVLSSTEPRMSKSGPLRTEQVGHSLTFVALCWGVLASGPFSSLGVHGLPLTERSVLRDGHVMLIVRGERSAGHGEIGQASAAITFGALLSSRIRTRSSPVRSIGPGCTMSRPSPSTTQSMS